MTKKGKLIILSGPSGTGKSTVVFKAMEQNFVPVVDDRNNFIGIITRKSILRKYISDLGLSRQAHQSGAESSQDR